MSRIYYSRYDRLLHRRALAQAFAKVRRAKGAKTPGDEGQTATDFAENLEDELDRLVHELRTKTYRPQPVRRVTIPKSGGGERNLGIPAVRDRVVQQALLEILQPIFDPDFHPSSYGYRPRRRCQQAVAKATMFVRQYGLVHVVDMDLSPVMRGDANYFRRANCKGLFRELMSWIRRRLRAKQLALWKRAPRLHRRLRQLGSQGDFLKIRMRSWRHSRSHLARWSLPNGWFSELGLFDLATVETGVLPQTY